MDELSHGVYRRPRPFSRGLTVSEPSLDCANGTSTQSSTRTVSITDALLRERLPAGHHAPGSENTEFSLEAPPRANGSAS